MISIVDLKDIQKYMPAFTPDSVRYLLSKKDENKFGECVYQPGGKGTKIYVDLKKVEEWLKKN